MPRPGPREVRIRVESAPLNPSDFMLIDGIYAYRPPLPSATGAEGVGTVVETGDDVTLTAVGDRVLILPSQRQGTWQEEHVVDERLTVPIKRQVDTDQLATVGINGATAHLLLRYGGQMAPGTWIAQTAANSNVGLFVIALARKAGLRTLNIVRRSEAVQPLLDAGADIVLVSGDNLQGEVAEVLADQRLALALDGVGGLATQPLAPFMAREASIVNYAAPSREAVAVHPMYLNFKNLHVHGFWMHNWLDYAPREEIVQVYDHIIDLVADGVLSTPIEARYDLTDYIRAMTHARAVGRHGKILFRPAGTSNAR
ncbi:trans-2-enoyl-CoA reductase [Streptomyces galbus]|nr:trans-2-enoyl-CoA reductase [Streptomyces galbus]